MKLGDGLPHSSQKPEMVVISGVTPVAFHAILRLRFYDCARGDPSGPTEVQTTKIEVKIGGAFKVVVG